MGFDFIDYHYACFGLSCIAHSSLPKSFPRQTNGSSVSEVVKYPFTKRLVSVTTEKPIRHYQRNSLIRASYAEFYKKTFLSAPRKFKHTQIVNPFSITERWIRYNHMVRQFSPQKKLGVGVVLLLKPCYIVFQTKLRHFHELLEEPLPCFDLSFCAVDCSVKHAVDYTSL